VNDSIPGFGVKRVHSSLARGDGHAKLLRTHRASAQSHWIPLASSRESQNPQGNF
jgi:hypothetical protein